MKNLFSKNARSVLLTVMMGSCISICAQTGPGGIGTTDGTSHLKLWLRGDKGVFSDAGETPATNAQGVQQWGDQSGNNMSVMQNTPSSQPLFATTGFNGFPALNFSSAPKWLNAALDINPSVRPNITVIAVASSPSFGIQTPFSKLWGHDNGGYDRAIGFDPRASSGIFGYFTGFSVGDMPFLVGTPAANEAFLSAALYSPTHFTAHLQGVISANDTANNGEGQTTFTIGALNDAGLEPWLGNIAELIVFDTLLTEAQRINIENYLSAKYGTAILGNDIYRMDNAINGNFDYDVTGIHFYFNDSVNIIRTARGTGIVTISNASNMFGGGSYFIGHDNGSLSPVNNDLPEGIANRLGRIWAGTENDGDLGTMDLSFDLPEITVSDPANLRLLIDRNKDGNFTDETNGDGVVSGFTRSGNTYTVNVNMGDGQRFTIGSVSTLTLPVNLRSIGVEKDGQTNKIQWKTDKETGFAYFEVQRSEDGMNFYKIGAVQTSKSTSAVKEYAFVDNAPMPANYYRLKMTDPQGKFSYSAVVKMIQTNKRFTISPNPATNIVSVTGLDGTAATIQLLDMNGKLLEQVKTTSLQHSFYLTKYARGTYQIKVSTPKDSFTKTIIKQ